MIKIKVKEANIIIECLKSTEHNLELIHQRIDLNNIREAIDLIVETRELLKVKISLLETMEIETF